MNEPQIIHRIQQLTRAATTTANPPPPRHAKQLLLGIGDDCAIYRPRPNQDLVFTTDFTIEGRHFTTATHTAYDVGYLALARSLSDLAAMGATPAFCLVSLALPQLRTKSWLPAFYRGLLALARASGIALAGGDLARSSNDDLIVADVMCCGLVPRGKALTRSGANPGDAIYVTGSLGVSALGLATHRGAAWKRHLRPQPRIAVGLALRRLPATAAMDLSDGLSLDLQRMCVASGLDADLTGHNLPIAPGATLEQALHGGEDYELLFAASPQKTRVPSTLCGIPITRIGTFHRPRPSRNAAKPGSITFQAKPLRPLAFDHFAPAPNPTVKSTL